MSATPAIPCLDWNATRATSAQTYAATLARACDAPLMHSSGAVSGMFGENIALVPTSYTPANVVGAWFAEGACYDYARSSCDTACTRALPVPSASCGHYTAVIWRDTTSVGCGVATCSDGRRAIWVCQYRPPGNVIGRRPY